MTPEQLRRILGDVAARAARTGVLPDGAEAGPPAGPIFRPAEVRPAGVVADWVTPVTQRWAPQLDLEARELARILAQGLTEERSVQAVEVAPSGLLAITLSDVARSGIIATVFEHADTWALAPGQSMGDVAEVVEEPGARHPGDPLRHVQLAHARLCRLIRNAEAVGVEIRETDRREELTHVVERHLLVALADLPQRLDTHAGDPQQTRRALVDLAALASGWQHPIRPAAPDEPILSIHGARLALATAARIVLRNGLSRVGAAAPERM
ncbi:anticodon-binding protein [Intrasporangium oryzae NRRL B-24470]|uniref:Anticodon-binding protein n=1 Tax=Intrasporangium oryzae NRRL B-24470 TaxID=1386089 RepID=W9G103_9MICO|nr:DALR anticodon-binding domain-containing protein [Intrasporangium oryzae]EWS99614.1 anticodon-binding protein [Intrasporangium oryzae NRRL B-24470]